MVPASLLSALAVVSPLPELLDSPAVVEVPPGMDGGPGWLEAKPVSAVGPLQARAPATRTREVAARHGTGSV